MKTVALAALFSLPALAAAAQDRDPLFKDVKMGDRVELTLRSGFAIRGKLVQVAIDDTGKVITKADPKVDLSTLEEILIDTSSEYPDISGQIGVDRMQVASVRKLRELTVQEAQALEKERQKALALMEKENDARRAMSAREEEERIKEMESATRKKKDDAAEQVGAELEAKRQRILKAKEIYDKFPESAGWGPGKIAEIAAKGARKQPVTLEEREFAESIELWNFYKNYLEGEKEKKEEKKLEPGPAPEKP